MILLGLRARGKFGGNAPAAPCRGLMIGSLGRRDHRRIRGETRGRASALTLFRGDLGEWECGRGGARLRAGQRRRRGRQVTPNVVAAHGHSDRVARRTCAPFVGGARAWKPIALGAIASEATAPCPCVAVRAGRSCRLRGRFAGLVGGGGVAEVGSSAVERLILNRAGSAELPAEKRCRRTWRVARAIRSGGGCVSPSSARPGATGWSGRWNRFPR